MYEQVGRVTRVKWQAAVAGKEHVLRSTHVSRRDYSQILVLLYILFTRSHVMSASQFATVASC